MRQVGDGSGADCSKLGSGARRNVTSSKAGSFACSCNLRYSEKEQLEAPHLVAPFGTSQLKAMSDLSADTCEASSMIGHVFGMLMGSLLSPKEEPPLHLRDPMDPMFICQVPEWRANLAPMSLW